MLYQIDGEEYNLDEMRNIIRYYKNNCLEFSKIPTDLYKVIFDYLSFKNLYNIKMVNVKLNNMINEEYLINHFVMKYPYINPKTYNYDKEYLYINSKPKKCNYDKEYHWDIDAIYYKKYIILIIF